MKNLFVYRLMFTAAIISFALASPPSHAAKERSFNAISYQYNVNSSPKISYRKFRSRIAITNSGGIRVIEIKNYLSKKSKPDARVTIAISGNDVGSAIYNGQNQLLAEFGKGERRGDNLYIFKQKEGENFSVASWFIDKDYIMSDYAISDKNNVLLYKEIVIYSAKSPSRKKK